MFRGFAHKVAEINFKLPKNKPSLILLAQGNFVKLHPSAHILKQSPCAAENLIKRTNKSDHLLQPTDHAFQAWPPGVFVHFFIRLTQVFNEIIQKIGSGTRNTLL